MTLADRRLHMIGIGGAGMSALAVVAYAWGADVSGCDRTPSEYSLRLRRFGMDVSEGHDRVHLEPGMEVVVSSAVPDELDELAAASELGLRVLHRGELLAELVAQRRSICVSGAHGKTTTTAMIAFAADRIGLDPTWLVGGEVPQLGGNAGPGGGDLLIAEGDESDGSCGLLRPRVAVVTNVDLDHHARYASVQDVADLFAEWVSHVPADGAVVLGDGVSLPAGGAPVVRFGFDEGANWQISGFHSGPEGSRFWLSVPDELPIDVTLRVPGAHNARNAAGAIAALAAAGTSAASAATALAEFTGVGRRFEVRGRVAGATVVDDYAHNPAKVAAVIDAARTYAPARVVVCFQPHLYSRTAASAYEFGGALAGADEVVVTEIYAARERPRPGVTAKLVVDALAERRPGMPLAYIPGLADAAGYLRTRVRDGDLVLTVGAGDVRRVGDDLLR
jgi:UDP-N-acetylmuramate--alanine ligase